MDVRELERSEVWILESWSNGALNLRGAMAGIKVMDIAGREMMDYGRNKSDAAGGINVMMKNGGYGR